MNKKFIDNVYIVFSELYGFGLAKLNKNGDITQFRELSRAEINKFLTYITIAEPNIEIKMKEGESNV